MRSAASSEQPERHDRPSHDRTSHDRNQPNRQQRGSRNNPEWMSDGGAVGEEDAAGLTAGARRAKDFEAERQRMKEEWRKEQAQLKGSTYQPVRRAACWLQRVKLYSLLTSVCRPQPDNSCSLHHSTTHCMCASVFPSPSATLTGNKMIILG